MVLDYHDDAQGPDYVAGFIFFLILFFLAVIAFVFTGFGIGGFDVAQLLFLMAFGVILMITIAVAKMKKEGKFDEAL